MKVGMLVAMQNHPKHLRRDYTDVFGGYRRDLWQGRAVRGRKRFCRVPVIQVGRG